MMSDYDALCLALRKHPECKATQAAMIDWLQEFRGVTRMRAMLEVEIEHVAAIHAREMDQAAAVMRRGSKFREGIHARIRSCLGLRTRDRMVILITSGEQLSCTLVGAGRTPGVYWQDVTVSIGARRVLRWVTEQQAVDHAFTVSLAPGG